MSKRKSFNYVRRQIRRALNAHPEAFHQLGLSRARRLGYGSGLSAHELVEHDRKDVDDGQ